MSYFISLLLHMFFKKLTEETVVDDNGAPNVGDLEWTITGPYTLPWNTFPPTNTWASG